MEPVTDSARQLLNGLDRCSLRYNSYTDLCTHTPSNQPRHISGYLGVEDTTQKYKYIDLLVRAEGRHKHLLTKWWSAQNATPVYVCMCASPSHGCFVLFCFKKRFVSLGRPLIRESQCSYLLTAHTKEKRVTFLHALIHINLTSCLLSNQSLHLDIGDKCTLVQLNQ